MLIEGSGIYLPPHDVPIRMLGYLVRLDDEKLSTQSERQDPVASACDQRQISVVDDVEADDEVDFSVNYAYFDFWKQYVVGQ